MTIKLCNWYGGKLRATHYINALLPDDCTEWYDLCCGSGAVTLNKPRHDLEVLNDLDPEMANLFSLMADREKGELLLERLLRLPYSKDAFDQAKQAKKDGFKGVDEYAVAEMTFTLITQSFNATRQSWRDGITQEEYTKTLYHTLPAVYKRLAGVQVTNEDCVDILRRIKKNEKACVFLDVPYRQELRGRGAENIYTCEMPMQKQIELLETIRDSKNKIILCGYHSEVGEDLYDKHLFPYGWRRYKLCELVKACQFKKHKDIAVEWIWVNYPLPEASKYLISHQAAKA